MTVLKWVLGITGALFVVATPVLWIIGMWTVGDNAARFGGTGLITLCVGGLLLVFARR